MKKIRMKNSLTKLGGATAVSCCILGITYGVLDNSARVVIQEWLISIGTLALSATWLVLFFVMIFEYFKCTFEV